MNITKAKRSVLDTVRAYLATDEDGLPRIRPQLQRPLFLVGPPGIGKTAIMSQVASELGIGLISYSMTHHTRQSALGLPVVQQCEYKGFTYEASEYTMSEIIASIYDYMRATGVEQGILFLDEINCVSETLYPSMLQFLQFKAFGKHAVPDGWVIACAGNPPEYNRSVHEFDVVTLDRVRRIEVEPDVDAWKAYAVAAGVHPAVTTFLDSERDCFYRIESTPGGKRFVTARGWDDLARMISLNELMDIPVDEELVGQFVQDPEIAEKFATYYELFAKYRSDYQVQAILAGEEGPEVRERAAAAPLDERMALLGLMLDVLAPRAMERQVDEAALSEARDVLREVKELALSGGDAANALDSHLAECVGERAQLASRGVADEALMRGKTRAIVILKACRKACGLARPQDGEEPFLLAHQEFRAFVGSFEADVSALQAQLDNAYRFLWDACGDGPEALLLTTELTARPATAWFLSRYGCDSFDLANQDLQVGDKRRELAARIKAAHARLEVAAQGGSTDSPGSGASTMPEAAGASSGRGSYSLEDPTNAQSGGELEAYYRNARWEYGYASLCHMALPAGLEGKTVLDVGCRRGKGVFKLSDRVGENGRAIGLDWVADHIEEASSRMNRAARETGLASNNMEFHLAYPEDLMAIGLGDATVDMAFVNSVLHLTYDPRRVLAELYRVLKPGGLLVCEVALASSSRDSGVVEAARTLGNSIQAAASKADFEAYLEQLGFSIEITEGPKPVEANAGFKKGHEVSVVPSDEAVSFEAVVLHCRK